MALGSGGDLSPARLASVPNLADAGVTSLSDMKR